MRTINKILTILTLSFWAIGVGIGIYVGFATIILNKDFGGRGGIGKRLRRQERIARRMQR